MSVLSDLAMGEFRMAWHVLLSWFVSHKSILPGLEKMAVLKKALRSHTWKLHFPLSQKTRDTWGMAQI